MLNKYFSIKQNVYFLSIFLAACLLNLAHAADEVGKIQEALQNIDKKLNKDFSEFTDRGLPISRVVITIAKTGEGKTTLHTFLAGKRLCGKKVGKNIEIDLASGEAGLPGFVISAGKASKTSIPSYWHENETIFYDLAGLFDNRGEIYKIACIYSLKRIFTYFHQTPIIPMLLASEGGLDRKYGVFVDVLKTITPCFQNHLEGFGQSACLIVSCQRDFQNLEEVKKELEDTETDPNLQLGQHCRDLIKAIRLNGNFAFFPYPKEEGEYLPLGSVQRNEVVKNIMDCVDRSAAVRLLNVNPVLGGLSPATILYVSGLAKNIFAEMTALLVKNVCDGVITYCQNMITQGNNPATLREQLRNFSAQFNFIKANNNDFDEFRNGFQNVSQAFGLKAQYETFMQKRDLIEFLRTTGETIDYPLIEWREPLRPLHINIERLGREPHVWHRRQDNHLFVQGFLVGTSDGNAALLERQQLQLSQPILVHLHGWNTLWIDQNIESHGTFLQPGISFSLIAPCLGVVGERTIDLSGIDGLNGADGQDLGDDGFPGQAGGNGCLLFCRAAEYANTAKLTTKASGGKAGDGGRGAKGPEGAKGDDGDEKIFTMSNRGLEFPGQWTQTYNDCGKPGKQGGTGGNGGHKGHRGVHGRIVVYGENNVDRNNHFTPLDAKHGEHGLGGRGGAQGMDHTGQDVGTWEHQEYYRIPKVTQTLRHIPRDPPVYAEDGKKGGPAYNVRDLEVPVGLVLDDAFLQLLLANFRQGYEPISGENPPYPYVRPFPDL